MTPDGWTSAALHELVEIDCQIKYGVVQPGPNASNGVLFVRSGDVAAGHLTPGSLRTITHEVSQQSRRTVLRGGELLIALVGQPGASVVAPSWLAGANIARQVGLVRLKPTSDVRYVQYFLASPLGRAALLHETLGSVQQVINLRDLEKVSVLMPALPEQRKIAAILSSVDDAIEATQAIIDHLGVVKKAMMAELLTRGLPGRHTRFKQTEIGEVPAEWNVLPADTACETVIDCKNRTPPYTPTGYPVIRTPNVRHGRLVTKDLRFTDAYSYREWTARGKPMPGDLVITREAPVGEVCLIPEGMETCLGQRMMLLRPASQRLLPRFLLAALQGDGIQRRLDLISGGSTVGHVRVGDIRALPLPVPTLDEQHAIGELFESIAERSDRERAVLNQTRFLKTSLMSVLLTGDVRVKPDEEAA